VLGIRVVCHDVLCERVCPCVGVRVLVNVGVGVCVRCAGMQARVLGCVLGCVCLGVRAWACVLEYVRAWVCVLEYVRAWVCVLEYVRAWVCGRVGRGREWPESSVRDSTPVSCAHVDRK